MRGRDISVERVGSDTVSGTRKPACNHPGKHWLSKSVGAADVAEALTQVAHSDPAPSACSRDCHQRTIYR